MPLTKQDTFPADMPIDENCLSERNLVWKKPDFTQMQVR